MRATHVDDELSIDGAGVDTNSPEAREQLHWDPAVSVHLTTQVEILCKVLVAEVVLSDATQNSSAERYNKPCVNRKKKIN